ncbi:hypothetical protein KFL_014250010 [Klebsormidium nitens]|uniref:Tyr recombinase domain-containing protein n=1 Tax=Klebsormidium nitens TaxID=105231 RepID=A0A1Y1IX20_KLENI|nr:hypothetical protein KFL_014250010 [Klebsormidium nitens]|eukprot:GAQ93297.1 hypothetical protein KFL_014250010 [Klebsormidium nitens]
MASAAATQTDPPEPDFDFANLFNSSPLRVDPTGQQDGLQSAGMNNSGASRLQDGLPGFQTGAFAQGPQGLHVPPVPHARQPGASQQTPEGTFSGSQIQALFSTFEDRIASRIEKKLSAVQDSVSGSSLDAKKRKAEAIKNEGIRKQYVPIEEASLRMHEVNSSLAAVAEGEAEPIGPEQAEQLREHLDQGIKFCTDRMQFLEIAETEGWSVAKKVEEDSFLLKLPEDLQSQVKKARKAVKADEQAKDKKKSGRKFRGSFRGGFSSGYRRFSGGRGGFSGVESDSLHMLSDLTESSEFEGFRDPPQPSASSSGQPQPAEPWLRNRLRDKLAFWKTFCTSVFVLSIITSGYQLPWSDGPPAGPRHFANHPSARLFSRSLHRVLSSRTSWRSILSLDQPALTELRFWRDSLEQFSSRPLWRNHSLVLVLNYDAGADGWGGHFLLHGVEQRARGVWAHDERHGVKSSTWRELEGLRRLLLSVGHLLRGHRVLARGDAMNVFWLLKKGGSRAEHLHSICLRIFWLCLELRIELLPEWVPRAQNQLADFLSKVRDVDDFSLQPGIFQQILRAFSPLHIDRFASSYNAQLPIFWSDLWSPHSAGANAFTDSWAGLRNYCFPPPRLVARVLEHARECSAEIVLVVLDWPGQPWWPLLVRDRGRAWAPFVRHALWFPPGPSTFRSGRGSADAFFGHGFPSCAVHVLDISFCPILQASGAIFLHHSLAGLPSPTSSPLVAMTREIAKRTKVAGQNVKKPLLASHCRRLFDLWMTAPSANLHTLMKLSAVTLCYVGFLRCSDLLRVQWQEVRFLPTHMEFFLEKSKTDQYRIGRWVLISRVGGPFCPVSLTERLLSAGQYASLGPGGLIRTVTIARSAQYIRAQQPSYSTVLSWFKDAARVLGLDPADYGTHSGRRGGATRAANVDVPDRLFKEHGSWKSERAKDGYVVISLPAAALRPFEVSTKRSTAAASRRARIPFPTRLWRGIQRLTDPTRRKVFDGPRATRGR